MTPVSPEVQQHLGEEEDDPAMPGPSPEITEYIKRLGLEPTKKGLGEPEPSKPKPTKVAPIPAATPQGHGASRSFGDESLLAKVWRGINEGDPNPGEHLDTGVMEKPPAPPSTIARPDATNIVPTKERPATFQSTADFARETRRRPASGPKTPSTTAVADATRVEPKMDQPQLSRADAARSMRETAGKLSQKAAALRAAGDTTGADDADRQALNATKAASASEETAGPVKTLISTMAQTLPFLKDPYEHENRIVREAAQPGAVPMPREQAAIGVEHPGTPTAAPHVASAEGVAGFAGQLPAFMLYQGIAGKAGGLLGRMAETIGEAGVTASPAARAASRGAERFRGAREILPKAGPQIPVARMPIARFQEEGQKLAAELGARVVKGLTEGTQGMLATSFASARSQGMSPEEALRVSIESIPEGIPFTLGMEALAAISGPGMRIGKEVAGAGARAAAGHVKAVTSGEAAPMVDAMRRVRDAHQLPNIEGAKTRYDTPEVVAARAAVKAMPSTHLDNSPERVAWREQARQTHLQTARSYAPNGEPEAGKQVFIIVGPPGAGKSSIIREIAQKHKAMVTDSDDAKKLSPEMQANPDAAKAVHLESSRINGQVLADAVRGGFNFIWPTVGSNAKDLGDRVADFKKSGYDVHVKYVGAPSRVTAPRIVNRWQAGQQGFVDPADMLALKGVPFATFRELGRRSDIASYEEYDNSVQGRAPQLVRSSADARAPKFTQEMAAPEGARPVAGRPASGERGVPRGNEPAARPEVARQPGLVGLMQEAVEAAPPKKTTVGDKARDLALRAAPHAAEVGEAVASHGHLAAPLVAAALPGSDEDKTKRAALAGAVFIAPRYRRQLLKALDEGPAAGRWASDGRVSAETWVQRLTTDMDPDHDARAKVREILYPGAEKYPMLPHEAILSGEHIMDADEVRALIERASVPERGVPLVSRLRKLLTDTPAENPRALGKAWDSPRPVADWIGKLQGAVQAGVKKEEAQLLIAALKGGEQSRRTPLTVLNEMLADPVSGNTVDPRTAVEWSYRLMVGDRSRATIERVLLSDPRVGPGDLLPSDFVREALAREFQKPANAIPAKLTRADILKLADEVLPKVERVVLGEREKIPDFGAEGLRRHGDPASIIPIADLEKRLPEAPWENREEMISQQIADRNAAKEHQIREIRRHRIDGDSIDVDADPASVIEVLGWDPSAMEAHIEARRERIGVIEADIESTIDAAKDDATDASTARQSYYASLRDMIGTRGMDRVETIAQRGWNGDGWARDAIDSARETAMEYMDSPDFDPLELLDDNGYRVEAVEPEWVVSPHEDQHLLGFDAPASSAAPGEVTYTLEQVQEFLAAEHNRRRSRRIIGHDGDTPGRTGHLDPDDFDVSEITEADVLRLYRSEHGNVPVSIDNTNAADEFVIVNRDGEAQTRNRGQEWRGDDEHTLAYEFIGENDLDQGLRDEQYGEVYRAVQAYMDAVSKENEADMQVRDLESDEENGTDHFESQRSEIALHREAIEAFEGAHDNPREAPADTGDRAAKALAARQAVRHLSGEIDKLIEIGRRTHKERKLLGAGQGRPEPQGDVHYDGTQVSPGPREDYTELIPIWANAPIDGRDPAQTHFKSYGFPEDIGHQRASTHLHYELKGLGEDGLFAIPEVDQSRPLAETFNPLSGAMEEYNDRVIARRVHQEELREIEAQLEPFDRIGMEGLTPEQRAEARALGTRWRRANDRLETAMKREARAISDLAGQTQLEPVRIRILEENQADPAQQAARRGVDRPGSSGSTPANPFMTGGTKKKMSVDSDGDAVERWDVNGDLTYRLGAINFLADAVERGHELIGWQDANTASAVHNFRRKAAKHVYEEVTPSAIRDGMRFAGIPEKDIPKPVHAVIAGAGHWVVQLTPEIRAAIKKTGLPIMGLLAMAASPRSANAQGQGSGDESNLATWLGTAGGLAVALTAIAWARKNKAPRPPAVQKMLAEAEDLTRKGRGRPKFLFQRREPKGQKYTAPLDVKQTASGKGAALFNVDKLGLSAEGEKVWTKVVTGLDLKKHKVSQAETMAAAEQRATSPDDLLKEGHWTGTDALAARLFQSSASERLAELAKQLTQGVKTTEEREAIQAEMARLTGDIGAIAKRASGERESAGRTLSAYKIVAKNTLDEPTWQMLGERAKGLALTTEEILKIRALTGAHDREGLTSFVSSLHRSSTLDKWLTFWKAGLLTGIPTHVANALSNAVESATLAAKEPLAVGIDAVLAMARGTEREKALSPSSILARVRGFGEGASEARTVMRTGVTAEEAGKWNIRKTNYDSPILQAYTDLVFNALAAGDRPFRIMALRASLDELAIVYARKAVKADPTLKFESVRAQLRKDPTNEMSARAIDESERAVFQNKGTLAKMTTGMMNAAREHPAARLVAETIVPFTSTPSNVATRFLDSTPIGLVTAILRQTKGEFSQARLAEDLARSLTGSGGLMLLGYWMASRDEAAGTYPTDVGDKARWQTERKNANSIKLGGHWMNAARLGPAGMTIAAGAQLHSLLKENPGNATKLVGGMLGTIGRVTTDQSFLRGVSSALSAVNDPVRQGDTFTKSLAGSVVPSMIGRMAQAIDPVQRETTNAKEQVQSRIPGLSSKLPAKLNTFGDPITRTTTERVGALVDPFSSTRASTDPVVNELERLDIGMPSSRKSVYEATGENRAATPEERRNETAGLGPILHRVYEAVITDPRYEEFPDETRRALLERASRLPADAMRYVGARRADASAPVDMIERKALVELRQLMATATQEANTGTARLSRMPRSSSSVVPAGTAVSPEVAAYLRQQRQDAQRRPATGRNP